MNALRFATLPLFVLHRYVRRPRARWVHVRIRPRLVEVEPFYPTVLHWLPGFAERRPTSLAALRRLCALVRADERIDGVVFEMPWLTVGWAYCQSLRSILLDLRASGRKVVAYLPDGGGNRELYVASAADRILTTPSATLAPLGASASVVYFKDLLDRAGLEAEVHRRAEYKTAAEPATRTDMSEAQREQLDGLLNTVDRALRQALLGREALDEEKVEGLFEAALLGCDIARERGLVDDACYEDELPNRVAGSDDPLAEVATPMDFATTGTVPAHARSLVRAPQYAAFRSAKPFRPLLPPPFVAVVSVHGTIAGGSPGSNSGRKLAKTVRALRAARKNPRVAGVIVHVDSRGGTPLASQRLHREIVRLKERKPVVAYLGDVAASGGYWVACAADAIVAQSLTITGSIGVVSARLVTEGLFEKIGLSVSTLRRAPHADMLGRPGRWSEQEAAIVEREVDASYRAFLRVVADGRARDASEVENVARGRVWSGQDALGHGLVDALGGLDTAMDEVRHRLVDRMDARARDRLEPKIMAQRLPIELAPAEPPAEQVARAFASIDPHLQGLFDLACAGEPVLCYALGLPTIR